MSPGCRHADCWGSNSTPSRPKQKEVKTNVDRVISGGHDEAYVEGVEGNVSLEGRERNANVRRKSERNESGIYSR